METYFNISFIKWDDILGTVVLDDLMVECFKSYISTIKVKTKNILVDLMVYNMSAKKVALKHSITENNACVINYRAKHAIKQLYMEKSQVLTH